MQNMKLRLFFIVFVFIFCAAISSGTAQSVIATVDRTHLAVNEGFSLSVEISGRNAGEPKLPDMANFAALAGRSSSQNIQFVNGRMSASTTVNYTFYAQAAGSFEIGPVEVEIDGQVQRSQPIRIEIVASSGAAPPAGGQQPAPAQTDPSLQGDDNALFLRAEVDRRTVYQNEPVIVTYKIYTLRNISGYNVAKLPNFAGFWVENFDLPPRPRTYNQVINGQRYLVAEIKRSAIFPQSTGQQVLEQMALECEVQMPRSRGRARDPFESFFDDPFFARTARVAISSKPVEIEVLPLPTAGRPASFNGVVGNYTLKATVDRTAVKTNEAVTLKITASGQGNIKTLTLPRLELPADFEVYDPKISENVDRSGGEISGNKTWEYVMVPRFAGTHEIKAVELSFFDARAKQYRTASTAPIGLSIEQGAAQSAAAGGGISKQDVRLLGQDIRFIAIAAAPFENIGARQYTRPWYIALLVLPVLAWAGAFWYQQQQEKLTSNVAYARSRKATKTALKHLHTAKKLLGSSDGKPFYAEVQKAMMGFLGNKLNVAEARLVTDDIEHLLQSKDVPGATISAYVGCLHACDFQRFAPSQANGAEMRAFYERAEKAIAELEEAL